VLICSDLSSHSSSEKFLNWCITKLRLSKADKVTLFHVFEWQDLTDLPLDDEVMAIGTGNLESIQSEEKKKVKEGIVKGMENLLKVAQEKGINAEVKIVEGVPKVKICEFAEKLKTDVVVMASRGNLKTVTAFSLFPLEVISFSCRKWNCYLFQILDVCWNSSPFPSSLGMGAMKRFFLGSNSDYCENTRRYLFSCLFHVTTILLGIHNCPSSVVIVREQDLKSIS